jgi:hypothetical protein
MGSHAELRRAAAATDRPQWYRFKSEVAPQRRRRGRNYTHVLDQWGIIYDQSLITNPNGTARIGN